MRIVFIGTAPFAVPSLRALVASGHEIALVVTQPDRPGHRLRLTAPPVKVAARALSLEIHQPERIRQPETAERLRATAADLHVVVAYGQIIPATILAIPPRGTLNVHGSLLPRHRGAAPVARAILDGDLVTGVTIMVMDELLDHGPVLSTRETGIGPRETASQLTERLASLGADLLVECLADLDRLQPREQDHGAATMAPKLSRQDGEIDWAMSAEEIDRRVRAFTPWPGVTLPFGEGRIKVISGHPSGGSGSPGEVLGADQFGVEVAAGSGAYVLHEVQLPGGRPVPARALVAGRT